MSSSFKLASCCVLLVALAGCRHVRAGDDDSSESPAVTSPAFRAAHAGTVLFASASVHFGHEESMKFVDRWQVGKPLYFAAYFAEPTLADAAAAHGGKQRDPEHVGVTTVISLDGKPINQSKAYMPADGPAFSNAIDWDKDFDPSDPGQIVELVLAHGAGAHTMKVQVMLEDNPTPLATGTIAVNLSKQLVAEVKSARRDKEARNAWQRAHPQSESGSAAEQSSDNSGASQQAPASSESSGPQGAHFQIDDTQGCDKNLKLLIFDGNGDTQLTYIGASETADASVEQAPGSLCVADEGGNNCVSNKAPITASTTRVTIAASCGEVTSE